MKKHPEGLKSTNSSPLAATMQDTDDKISTHSKNKNFLEEEETKNNNSSIERCCCCCHCCTDLRTKILHENFRLGVVLGFGH